MCSEPLITARDSANLDFTLFVSLNMGDRTSNLQQVVNLVPDTQAQDTQALLLALRRALQLRCKSHYSRHRVHVVPGLKLLKEPFDY